MSHSIAHLDWTETGAPRSSAFGDIYFSPDDGLAETRAVFLEGCGLPGAWAGRDRFCVAELGFGTGLNIAALLALWRETAPPDARLNIFTIEAHPVSRADAHRALAHWPELGEASEALLDRWPSAARGFQRLDLPDFRATLDIAVMDVERALGAWSGLADAWFLDGFSPALNPAMWSEAVLALVAARSNPGARAASFTVAGAVRRGLEAAGFAVEKQPGYGRKKQRLEARLPGVAPSPARARSIAVIGAGIAGAALALAFRAQGLHPMVIADDSAAASGNPAALVAPGLDASGREAAGLYAQTFARAVNLYHREPVVIAQGVTRLPKSERDPRRFAKVAAQDLFAPDTVTLDDDGGLIFHDGLVVEPAAVLAAWLPDATISGQVSALSHTDNGWRIDFTDDRAPLQAEIVVIAAGWGSAALAALPLAPIRGQASFARSAARPGAIVDGDYLIPTRDGFLCGATQDRDRTDTGVEVTDHQRNLAVLARLAPELAAGLSADDLQGRATIRAATPDRLPLAGVVEPGLLVLSGLGSRGFTTAPLLAEQVVALALGQPSPLPADLADAVDPQRG